MMSYFIMLRRVLLDRCYVELLNYMSPSFPPTTLSPPSCVLMDVYRPCFTYAVTHCNNKSKMNNGLKTF